jgi:hypothetical protein
MEKNKQNQTIITVQLEYLDGPIFKDVLPARKGEKGPFGGIGLITGVPVIDRDPEVARLEREIESLYSGCFSENSHEQPPLFRQRLCLIDQREALSLCRNSWRG